MKILIVEDEALLAMELESEVEDAGHEIVGIAADSKEAIELANKALPQFAFVDIQLLDGPTESKSTDTFPRVPSPMFLFRVT